MQIKYIQISVVIKSTTNFIPYHTLPVPKPFTYEYAQALSIDRAFGVAAVCPSLLFILKVIKIQF